MKKVLLIGEPLIRITPTNYQELTDGVESRVFFGGSEINVACNLQGFGCETKLLTALPQGSLGDRFLDFLDGKGIDTSGVQRKGERVGVYYMEAGFGCRSSQVYYDRGQSSLEAIQVDHFDMEQLFLEVGLVHFSGITVAIGSAVRAWLVQVLKEAKRRKIPISMDLNWRSKMIGLRDAKKVFSQFATYADYCFGLEPIMTNEKDWELFERDTATVHTIRERMQTLKEAYKFQAIFHTIRQTDELGRNLYKAYGLADEFCCSQELKTQVLQRVGSGDAFVAGALYKLLEETSLKAILDFAVASGTYKCSIEGDHMRQSLRKVESLLERKNDIIR